MNSVETEVVPSLASQEIAVPTAGAMLKAAREASGLHIAALAVAMKVPVKKLEALESDRFDQMPDAVFVRALASGVCRALKIDAGPIMDRLPKSTIPRLGGEDRGINTPFTAPNNSRGIAVPDFLAKPAVLAVIALMLGVLVLVLFPDSPTEAVKGDSQPVAVLTMPAEANVTVAAQVFPAAVEPAPVASAAVSQPSLEKPAVAAVAVAAPKVPEVSVPATEAVTFNARGTSWLEVKDVKGVVLLSTTLKAGENATATGTFPMSIVIGRVDVTDVQVRGKPFPLDTFSKDNVARFEVK